MIDSQQIANKRLGGRYIITCTSSKDGHTLYYQDRSITKKRYWTRDIGETLGFPSDISAKSYCKRLRYNKPTVQYVDPETYQLTAIT